MFKKLINVVLFLVVLQVFVGCSNTKNKMLTLPINSDFFASYYTETKHETFPIYLLPQYKVETQKATNSDSKMIIKGEHWGKTHIIEGTEYYDVGYFKKDNFSYRIIMYNQFGESDTPLFNIQINSYDKKDNLIDSLLLDSQFAYEGIERFNKFAIQKNGMIDLNYYVVRVLEIVDGGELGDPIENPAAKEYIKEQYQIDDGVFKLISRKRFDD